VARALVVCALALLAACHGAGTPCGDGYCQSGTVCTADRQHCVYPEQLTSCVGLADGTACDIRGADGACRGSLCLPVVCGDGFVQPGEEECDGALLGVHTDCLSLDEGYHQAGSLSCTSDCTLDRTACGDRCGDGITQTPLEACDVTVGAQTCESAGFHGGTLGCKPDCQLDVSSCDGWCGDGLLTSQEECDRTDFGLATCNTYGYYGGNLRCTAACKIAEDQCVGFCGDGIKNGSELCDGNQLAGLSCQTYGYYGGALTCGPDCLTVDRAECEGYCGDGVKNGNELCDGLDHEDNSCASLGAIAGALGCNAYCQPTTDACTWGSFRLMARVRSMDFTAVWASSPRDMWASSEAEHLLHFDGERWTPVDVDLQAPISRFWGSNDGHVWAWSVDGRLAVHDGRGWTVAHRDLGDASVAASSPSNVWVANPRERTLRHFDGSHWSELAMPAFVEAVFTLEDGTAWISGVYLEHYDGVEWTSHDLGGGLTHCLWGTSDRDVYAIAYSFDGESQLFHYDGETWTRQAMPFGVDLMWCGWSDGADRMWIDGFVGTQSVFVLIDNGAPWLVPADAINLGRTWSAGGQLWMYNGADVMRLDGPPWTPRGLSAIESTSAIAVSSPTAALVGAARDLYFTSPSEIRGPFPDRGRINGLYSTDALVWIASGSGVLRYDRDDVVGVFDENDIREVWAAADDDVWAIATGDFVHFDGTAWTTTPGVRGRINNAQLTGTSAANLWALINDRVFRNDHGRWIEVHPLGAGARITSIAATGTSDLWLFDAVGNSYRHDGQEAQRIEGSWARAVRSVWAASARDVWAVSDDSALHHFDGVVWSEVGVPESLNCNVVAGGWDTVWVGGDEGALYNLPVPPPATGSEVCPVVLPAYCNVTVHGHTAETVDGPTDCSHVAHPGGELYYKIEVPVTGRLTAEVLSRYDVDLSIMRADSRGGCDVASCVGTPITDSKVLLDVEQGQTYFLVVGARDEAAPFTLDVDCIKE
jgi:hypothetical protein